MSEKTPEKYEFTETEKLQIELLKLQRWLIQSREKILVIFEGRDAAGKGGAIFTIARHLNPRHIKIVALPKPTEQERGQWFFQRYISQLPGPGQLVFFDRSWYNRAVVEPVLGFCTQQEYEHFIRQVNLLEKLLVESNITIVKFWFSVTRNIQQERLKDRESNPLKSWKLSTVDRLAQEKWQDFTKYKENMFRITGTQYAPWNIIDSNDKKIARHEAMRVILNRFDYPEKSQDEQLFNVDPQVVQIVQNISVF